MRRLVLPLAGMTLVLATVAWPIGASARPQSTAALSTLTPGTWAPTGDMTTPRSLFTATRLRDGRVLVVGGRDGTGAVVASAELYDPTSGLWTATGSMHVPRIAHTATLLPNGRVLVTGGQNSSGALASVESYNPLTGTWRRTTHMNTRRVAHVAALVKVAGAWKVLVAGGSDVCQGCTPIWASAELFDLSSHTWSYTGSLSAARFWGPQTPVRMRDGRVLVVGGAQCCPYTWLNEAEIYDPATETWTVTASKDTNAQGPAALVPPERIVVVGGIKGVQPYATTVAATETFNGVTNAWKRLTKMSVSRDIPTLTVLASGEPLVVGGYTGGWGACTALKSAEIYVPGVGWQSAGSMATPRLWHVAALLEDGTVLVAGGQDCAGNAFASAEIYQP